MIAEIKEILSSPKDVAIISHRNPDGDAIGSSLGLKLLLEKSGHVVKVIFPSDYPSTFYYLKAIDSSIVFDQDHDLARTVLKEANVIFCLDFNSLDRIDKLGTVVDESKAHKVLIDHHMDPEPFADFMISEPSASSTCELVFNFIQDLGKDKEIDIQIGECLYTGIITDTGAFRYNTNPRVFEIAAALKNKGVDDYELNNLIFNTMTEKQLRLLGHCLANRFELIPEYQSGIIYLTKEDYKTFEIKRGDTEGIVNYILMIKGINVAAFITEQPTIVKVSLRSKGDISVQEIARNHFKGGGHKNASGGAAYAKLEDVVDRFKKVLPDYIKKTN